ncbi:MAG: hypothetical protein IJD35_05595 [Clostridia bacterium]|nr:hypothetical protein [Clostridia bacterium]
MKHMKEEQFEANDRDAAGDITVKKSRALDNVAKVMTLVLAVAIWLYVVATNVVEKPLPLTVKEKNGLDFSDRVTLEYQSLLVKGASALVDPLQNLQLEDFSAKTLDDADGDGVVEIELALKEDTLPEGISEILKSNGSSFANGKVKVKAMIKVGHSHELKVPKSYVKVSNSGYEMVDDFVTLTIRSLGTEDDHTLFNQLTAYLDPNNTEAQNAVITVFANVEENTAADRVEVPISVSFEGNFKGNVYEVLNSDGTPYTVTIQKIASGDKQ